MTAPTLVPRAEPATVDGVVTALRESDGRVVPIGSGSKRSWAPAATATDLELAITGLRRVVDHQPGDLVVVAEAGVRLADLQLQLADSGQMLALDSPEIDATLGGIVSANASGPRRLRYGTVRDLLIGITVVLADGTVARSGGKVVKNVAGYDLAKLYTGAHGALGVVVSTTWRLHPLPPARRAVIAPVGDARHAGKLASALARSSLTPTAVELGWKEGHGELVALFESIPASVEHQSLVASDLTCGHVTDDPPDWFGVRPSGPLVLRMAYEPFALPHVLEALPTNASGTMTACTGVAYFTVPGDTDLDLLRARIRPYDGSVAVIAADRPRAAGEHWGPVDLRALALMKRVKDEFDPLGRLSPGRLVGGL